MQLFLNNFESTFIASVNAAPVTGTPATELDYGVLRINPLAAGLLLNPGADYYVLTALKRSGSLETMLEVMKCTAVDNSVGGECRITVQRAQEGTTAQAYVAGDIISLRWTKGSAANMAQNADNLASLANAATARANLGLGNVDNTSDANKPVSTAQAAADLVALNSAKAYADGLVAGLLDDRGNHDASGNTWPTTGGSGTAGAIMKGDFWYISVGGALGGVTVNAGDSIRALVDTPGTTAANWSILESNLGFTPESSANKNASGGYAGLSGYKIQLRNDSNTYTNLLRSTSTAARTWLFQDRDGTLADIDNAQIFTKAQRGAFVALTDAATVAVDLSAANQFNLVLGGNRTLGVPTNVVAGQQGIINVYQDTTGMRTLAYSWCYSWAGSTAGTLSTPGCTRDMLAYSVDYYATGTFTTTIATPSVMTMAGHGMTSGQKLQSTTTGALPTGLTASTTYYVHVIDANTFHLCTSLANVAAGTYIATSGAQSGVHTLVSLGITLALSKAIP